MDIKKEELGLRKFEAETRRMEVEMQKQKHEFDYKAKIEELELKKISEAAQNLEKQAMTQALLDLLKKNNP